MRKPQTTNNMFPSRNHAIENLKFQEYVLNDGLHVGQQISFPPLEFQTTESVFTIPQNLSTSRPIVYVPSHYNNQ